MDGSNLQIGLRHLNNSSEQKALIHSVIILLFLYRNVDFIHQRSFECGSDESYSTSDAPPAILVGLKFKTLGFLREK